MEELLSSIFNHGRTIMDMDNDEQQGSIVNTNALLENIYDLQSKAAQTRSKQLQEEMYGVAETLLCQIVLNLRSRVFQLPMECVPHFHYLNKQLGLS